MSERESKSEDGGEIGGDGEGEGVTGDGEGVTGDGEGVTGDGEGAIGGGGDLPRPRPPRVRGPRLLRARGRGRLGCGDDPFDAEVRAEPPRTAGSTL